MPAPVASTPWSLGEALLRRPLVSAACCFAAGVLLSRQVLRPGWLAGAALVLAVALLGSSLTLGKHAWAASLALALAFIMLGDAAGTIQSTRYRADHIGRFVAGRARLVQVELRLVSPPRVLGAGAGVRPLPPRQVVHGELCRIATARGWSSASGEVIVHLQEPHPRLAEGQTVRVTGMLSRPGGAENPGQFDWQHYYRDQRILASLSVPHAANLTIVADPGAGVVGRLRATARAWLEAGFDASRSVEHALLRALVLGDSDPQLRDIQDEFVRTGTSHHLAISGMHIAVIAGLALWLCRMLGLTPRRACLAALGIAILYACVVLPNPPVVRSILLCAAIATGLLVRRGADGVQLLALSVLAMLVYDPLDLFNAGFQLSFGTVLGLMVFSRPALGWLASFRDPDIALAANLQPRTRWRRVRQGAWRGLSEALVAAVVAWLVSAPLIAGHFNQLNPWAILASILLAVPVLLALVAGVGKIVLTGLVPGWAGVLAMVAAWPVGWMRWMVHQLDRLPGSDRVLPAPSLGVCVAYYLLLALPMLLRNRGVWQRRLRWTPALCPALLLVPLAWSPAPAGREAGSMRVVVLSVGAGQCAVAQLPDGRTWVFDAGSSSITDLQRSVIHPALRQLGVSRIDAVFISHDDYDHYSALPSLAKQYAIGRIYVIPGFAGSLGRNAAGRGVLEELDTLGVPLQELARGQAVEAGEDARLEVLWPPAGARLAGNDASLVLKLTGNGRSLLLTGDIELPTEHLLLRDAGALKADVLMAPHHGSADGGTAGLVTAVGPRVIVASSDRTPSARQETFDAVAGRTPLLRTGRDGAVTLTVGADGSTRIGTQVSGRTIDWQ